MKARAAKSLTADMFAVAENPPALAAPVLAAPALAAPALVAPALAAPVLAVPALAVPALAAPVLAARPAPTRRARLWYAVVFPHLLVPPSIAAARPPSAAAVAAPPGLEVLCLHAQSFTSCVSIELPNALLLEVRGSLRLFESLEHLHGLLDARWQSLAIAAHSAIAPATLAALWSARAGLSARIDEPSLLASRLAPLPLACTGWDEERLRSLRSMGITRLGELLRLPRAGLARRLGVAAVRELDIATGREVEPRRAFVARRRFRERLDFEAEIENVAYLERACEPVLDRCAGFLRERQAGIQALQLRLHHRDGPATLVRLGFAGITGERRRLADVLGERLERLELPAPVRALELVSGPLLPLSAASLDVFGAGGRGVGTDTAQRLVERLRARLGESAVYGVAAIADHRPEAAWRRVQELPLEAGRAPVANTAAAAGPCWEPMPRPLWLFDAPILLDDAESPRRRGWVLEPGPERIESGWWDGKGVARDYYRAREGHGGKLWIFQERRTKRWYWHGVFA